MLLVTEAGGFLEQALLAHGALALYRVKPEDYAALGRGSYELTIFSGWRPPAWPSGSVLAVGLPPGQGLVLPGTGTYQPAPATYAPGAAGHPVLRYVDWSEVHVAEAVALELDPGWQPLLVAGPAPGAAAGAPAGGAAPAAGLPLLAVQEAGSSRRAVLAFDLQDSDLPLRAAFPVLLTNLVEWLAPRAPALPGQLTPGTALPVPPLPLAEALDLVQPDGSRISLAPPWPAAPIQPQAPGLYQLVQVRGDGREVVSLLPVAGYLARESRIAPQPELPLAPAGTEPAPAQPWPLWPWLALAALIVSFIEWWVDARGL